MDRLQLSLAVLDYAAVAVFGATGALAAARRKHDIVTFGFFAAVTGVGGGTLRDLLIDAPVFWVARPAYLVVSLAAGLAVWVLGGRGSGPGCCCGSMRWGWPPTPRSARPRRAPWARRRCRRWSWAC